MHSGLQQLWLMADGRWFIGPLLLLLAQLLQRYRCANRHPEDFLPANMVRCREMRCLGKMMSGCATT